MDKYEKRRQEILAIKDPKEREELLSWLELEKRHARRMAEKRRLDASKYKTAYAIIIGCTVFTLLFLMYVFVTNLR